MASQTSLASIPDLIVKQPFAHFVAVIARSVSFEAIRKSSPRLQALDCFAVPVTERDIRATGWLAMTFETKLSMLAARIAPEALSASRHSNWRAQAPLKRGCRECRALTAPADGVTGGLR
jgi:hypothetical protein